MGITANIPSIARHRLGRTARILLRKMFIQIASASSDGSLRKCFADAPVATARSSLLTICNGRRFGACCDRSTPWQRASGCQAWTMFRTAINREHRADCLQVRLIFRSTAREGIASPGGACRQPVASRIITNIISNRSTAFRAWGTFAGIRIISSLPRRCGTPPTVISATPSNTWTRASNGAVCSLRPWALSKANTVTVGLLLDDLPAHDGPGLVRHQVECIAGCELLGCLFVWRVRHRVVSSCCCHSETLSFSNGR